MKGMGRSVMEREGDPMKKNILGTLELEDMAGSRVTSRGRGILHNGADKCSIKLKFIFKGGCQGGNVEFG